VAHRRKPLAWALALNTAVLIVEVGGGVGSGSLSLILDGIHNLSDELALALLVLAYTVRTGISGRFLRYANLFNSVGLLAICAFFLWQVFERLTRPVSVIGALTVITVLLGALGNWGVARVLRSFISDDPAIRLAYAHNLSDTLLSLVPVVSGALVMISGQYIFDPIATLVIVVVIVVGTVQSFAGSHRELLWPENVACGHSADVVDVEQGTGSLPT
jgi:cobalt-zinc-cadmium efflux system protein